MLLLELVLVLEEALELVGASAPDSEEPLGDLNIVLVEW